VADDCFAIPFVNDTHLANDPARDPDFDRGEPRSQFQEVFAYRVPNIAPFGGTRPQCGRAGDDDRGDGDDDGGGPDARAAARRVPRAVRAPRLPARARRSVAHTTRRVTP
jgi:hypothetical protein